MGESTGMARAGRGVLALALAGGWLLPAAGVVAQEEPPGDPRPPALDEDEPRLPRPASETRSVSPVRRGGVEDVRPGLTEGVDWLGGEDGQAPRTRRVLGEGTFLSGREGRVVRGPAGRVIFVPREDDRAPGERAMLVLPCATLERLERAMALDASLDRVTFTGQVTVYDGRNYLLPSRYARLGAAETDTAGGDDDTPPGEGGGETPPPALRDDPEVRELIEALESRPRGVMGEERGGEELGGAFAAAGGARAPAEGSALVRRRGRLVRDGAGGWTLRFDNGPSTGPGDEPLGVLPCMLLMAMEKRAVHEGDDLDMLVSGRIYSYRGRGYVLPTLMQLVPRGGINPLQ